jgi:hypothetical protein
MVTWNAIAEAASRNGAAVILETHATIEWTNNEGTLPRFRGIQELPKWLS